jgi:UDP-2,3-diacylglucosamine pyrophosphatase LpxH
MKKYRTVIISDIHLGSKASMAKDVCQFLDEISCDRLILNGDIIDMWSIRRKGKWTSDHSRFLKKLRKFSKKTEVIYLIGNHDDFLLEFAPMNFQKIKIRRDYILHSNEKSYYIFHGDVIDPFSARMRWLAIAGSIGYDAALWINRQYNRYRKWRSLPYFSISQVIKSKVKSAVSFVQDFRTHAIKLAKSKGCDVAVCGHIHLASIDEEYMNSGDWCESCTALVEDLSGNWSIVKFHS